MKCLSYSPLPCRRSRLDGGRKLEPAPHLMRGVRRKSRKRKIWESIYLSLVIVWAIIFKATSGLSRSTRMDRIGGILKDGRLYNKYIEHVWASRNLPAAGTLFGTKIVINASFGHQIHQIQARNHLSGFVSFLFFFSSLRLLRGNS